MVEVYILIDILKPFQGIKHIWILIFYSDFVGSSELVNNSKVQLKIELFLIFQIFGDWIMIRCVLNLDLNTSVSCEFYRVWD